MKFKFRHTDKIVGIFFFTAVLVLIVSFFVIAISQKMFARKFVFYTRFEDAIGLSPTTTLKFKGFDIGKIKKFWLTPENLIEAELTIYQNYRDKIVTNSAINKSSNPITGRSTLEFLQGPDLSNILPEGGFIPSLSSVDGQKLLAEGKIIRKGDVISSIMDNVDLILENLNRDDNPEAGSLFRLLYNLANATHTLNNDLIALESLLDTMQTELTGTTEILRKTLASTNQLVENYSDPSGIITQMIDPDKKELIEPLSRSLQQVNTNLIELERLLNFLNEQTPELGDIILEGRNSLKMTQRTLQGINNNPLLRGGISRDPDGVNKNSKIRLKDWEQ